MWWCCLRFVACARASWSLAAACLYDAGFRLENDSAAAAAVALCRSAVRDFLRDQLLHTAVGPVLVVDVEFVVCDAYICIRSGERKYAGERRLERKARGHDVDALQAYRAAKETRTTPARGAVRPCANLFLAGRGVLGLQQPTDRESVHHAATAIFSGFKKCPPSCPNFFLSPLRSISQKKRRHGGNPKVRINFCLVHQNRRYNR